MSRKRLTLLLSYLITVLSVSSIETSSNSNYVSFPARENGTCYKRVPYTEQVAANVSEGLLKIPPEYEQQSVQRTVGRGWVTVVDCCEGWTRKEDGSCETHCEEGCFGGTCTGPNECTCERGWRAEAGVCKPECQKPCAPNAYCFSPDVCTCQFGYDEQEGECRPVCLNDCANGRCVAPRACQCFPGFKLNASQACEPICTSECEHGSCVRPGVCACDDGYVNPPFNREACVPHCPNTCVNGECSEPDVCTCKPGYKEEKNFCVPVCQEGCENGECVAPEQCSCNPGYILNRQTKKCVETQGSFVNRDNPQSDAEYREPPTRRPYDDRYSTTRPGDDSRMDPGYRDSSARRPYEDRFSHTTGRPGETRPTDDRYRDSSTRKPYEDRFSYTSRPEISHSRPSTYRPQQSNQGQGTLNGRENFGVLAIEEAVHQPGVQDRIRESDEDQDDKYNTHQSGQTQRPPGNPNTRGNNNSSGRYGNKQTYRPQETYSTTSPYPSHRPNYKPGGSYSPDGTQENDQASDQQEAYPTQAPYPSREPSHRPSSSYRPDGTQENDKTFEQQGEYPTQTPYPSRRPSHRPGSSYRPDGAPENDKTSEQQGEYPTQTSYPSRRPSHRPGSSYRPDGAPENDKTSEQRGEYPTQTPYPSRRPSHRPGSSYRPDGTPENDKTSEQRGEYPTQTPYPSRRPSYRPDGTQETDRSSEQQGAYPTQTPYPSRRPSNRPSSPYGPDPIQISYEHNRENGGESHSTQRPYNGMPTQDQNSYGTGVHYQQSENNQTPRPQGPFPSQGPYRSQNQGPHGTRNPYQTEDNRQTHNPQGTYHSISSTQSPYITLETQSQPPPGTGSAYGPHQSGQNHDSVGVKGHRFSQTQDPYKLSRPGSANREDQQFNRNQGLFTPEQSNPPQTNLFSPARGVEGVKTPQRRPEQSGWRPGTDPATSYQGVHLAYGIDEQNTPQNNRPTSNQGFSQSHGVGRPLDSRHQAGSTGTDNVYNQDSSLTHGMYEPYNPYSLQPGSVDIGVGYPVQLIAGPQAMCEIPCLNGDCIGPNTCLCKPGYGPDFENPFNNRGSCMPICNGGCPNGICSAPGLCLCKVGFIKEHGVKTSQRCVPAHQ